MTVNHTMARNIRVHSDASEYFPYKSSMGGRTGKGRYIPVCRDLSRRDGGHNIPDRTGEFNCIKFHIAVIRFNCKVT